MKVTIGITSHNRGLYLDALLSSISDDVKHYQHQVIVVDNSSTEQAVFDACERHSNIIDQFHKRDQFDWINDEYIAKNVIIDNAKHDVILFLQDDMQNIGYNGCITFYANALRSSNAHLLIVNPMRKSTIASTVSNFSQFCHGLRIWQQKNVHLGTTGFFKKAMLLDIGPYPTNWPKERAYWGRSEDWYDSAFKQKFGSMSHLVAQVPTFLPVWNDPRGGYAFNRDGKRWGYYEPPMSGNNLYYEHLTFGEFNELNMRTCPCSFVDVAKPLGWKLALDENGDTKKYPQIEIMKEG